MIKGLFIYSSVVFFNLFLGAYMWLPRFELFWIFVPLPESAAAALLLFIIAYKSEKSKTGIFSLRLLLPLYTLLFLLLQIFILLEAFFQHVYQRTFQIAGNLQLASGFFNMLFRTELFSDKKYLALSVTALFFLLFLFFIIIFRALLPLVCRIKSPRSFLILIPLMLISFFYIPGSSAAERLLVQLKTDTFQYEKPDIQILITEPSPSYSFPGIEDRNIHLFIVESYGMTVFTNPHHSRRLEDFFTQSAEILNREGFYIYSGGYNSTTFGGTSWLADATILTGININTQSLYNQVVKNADEPNLLHLLESRGYKTILSAPGTKFMTPEYSGFYRFSKYIMHADFEYEGPYFTYGDMPDQYQLFHTQTKTVAPALLSGRPLFVKYILCSSHVPWNYIPPYIDSWSGFDSGRIYLNRSNNTWYENSWAAGSALFEGYTHSIRYSLESVFGYIVEFLGDKDLAVIIGDHQPKFPVSEKGAGFGVPVHVVAKDNNMLFQFSSLGYNNGILPPETENLPGLEKFLPHFLYIAEGTLLNLQADNDLY